MDTTKDIMTPVEALPSISSETCLLDAADALKQSAMNAPVPLLVSIRDANGKIMGIVNMVDLLRGLNPKYAGKGFFESMEELGLKESFIRIFIDWRNNSDCLDAISKAASTFKVKDVLRTPTREETVDAGAPADAAIDLMVIGRRDHLYVTSDGCILGIIDAASIFDALLNRTKGCGR